MPNLFDKLIPALVVSAALASVGLFHTWQRVEGIRLSYRLGELSTEYRELSRQHGSLQAEVAMLKAPARINRVARLELGMAPPRPGQVVVVQEDPMVVEAVVPEETDVERDERGSGGSVGASLAAVMRAREGPRG